MIAEESCGVADVEGVDRSTETERKGETTRLEEGEIDGERTTSHSYCAGRLS